MSGYAVSCNCPHCGAAGTYQDGKSIHDCGTSSDSWGERRGEDCERRQGIRDSLRAAKKNGRKEWIDVLEKLVLHCSIHSGYPNCGYSQMSTDLKLAFDDVMRRRSGE